jgi:hypothetical protein
MRVSVRFCVCVCGCVCVCVCVSLSVCLTGFNMRVSVPPLPKPGTLNPNLCVHRSVSVSDSESGAKVSLCMRV